MTSLLCGNLAVVLNVDVLVGGEGVDLVVGKRGAETCVSNYVVRRQSCRG